MKNRHHWKSIRITWFILAGIILLVSAGCNLPDKMALKALGPGLWIDAPRDGVVLPLAPYKVVIHGSDEAPIARYDLYINGELKASFGGASRGMPNLQYAEYLWQPEAMGEYTIQVRAQNNAGSWGNQDQVTVRIGDPTPAPSSVAKQMELQTSTLVVTATPEFTLTPTLTLTPTIPPTPEGLFAKFKVNANCRLGPSIMYDVVTSLLTDQQVQVLGYNNDNAHLWWYIQLPNSAARCWVSDTTVEITGNRSKSLYYTAPLLPPTETPEKTDTPTITARPPTRTPTPTMTLVIIH